MAKMHTRRKGKSSSKRPMLTENPSWVTMSASEIEEVIVKMAKNGQASAMIGLVLRDQYGVPDVKLATGKTVTEIMTEKGVASALPEDISNLMRRAISLNVHLRKNPGDVSNRRGLNLIEAKIRRLEHYYKDNGVLPENWKYSLSTAELMLK
ncbi:MAG: 30S ribosomal protein S15 [Candidatus Methanomethylophilaceae archaeon]|jgi:small subunit ribosomal protein S15|nr:30S ribosomal protein S15 [Methanomassiliicoccales archaeon RumEn M2]MDD2532493.1 30S ribosomal protein S15 [Candidatus Methanomethylophilaceae archaeon]MDI9378884.1 30S ribosomal protein S15 [Candidatus Thermoplasmatota archaeon]MDD3127687.1 30S ribosomal protein S15 [Candidatus Methanomethylophilaceae archaeon]MDD4119167.1 30S ribosomal protein S15 [Candidatus Methanomethylophilaceae archaeon]